MREIGKHQREKQMDVDNKMTKEGRDTKRNKKCERMNKITACFSAHSFSPGTIEEAELVTNNKNRCLAIGSFSSECDLLNSSITAP